MHPNKTFRKASTQANLDFVEQRAFGTLCINANNGPLLSHIPFMVSSDGKRLEAHLVRSNPILPVIGKGIAAVIAVNGADAYISPDWYEIENQVPTWNYIAVHLRGKLTKLPPSQLTGILERLSHRFENRLLPKPIWKMEKLERDGLEKMLRMLVPIAIDISEIEGTWKLGQNKPEGARLAVVKHLSTSDIGSNISKIATLMKEPPC